MDVSIFEFGLAVLVVAFAAAVQGTIGLGFNIVAVPVMSLINPLLAPVPQLILSLPQTAAAFARERSGVDRSGVLWILAGRLPGALIGVWLLSVATDRLLDVMIGSLVLIAVVILATGIHIRRNRTIEFSAGVFAGVSSYVSTIGGPPMALLYSRSEGATIRSTLGLIFFVGTSITAVVRILAGDITRSDWILGAALLPAAAIGFSLSSWLKERASPGQLRVAIVVVSSVAAGALLLRAATA
ncbi:MAG: sulfite exporter TauE/SafE family protein [Acidimicrobiia bacterium]|nr:sulfite exporter TauE/SafE family protein [Acidimicrobiia bacterium]